MSNQKASGQKIQRQKILLYGVNGLVGTRIKTLLSQKFKIIAPPHRVVDLRNKKLTLSHLEDVVPDQIVYAAGLTKVDEAYENPEKAFYLNAEAPQFIAKLASSLKIPLHYLSTDAVFNGQKSHAPYNEEDGPKPISVYGKSKLRGEILTLSASHLNSVIRTEMVYSSYFQQKKDLARAAYESLKSRQKFAGIENQVITPTFVDDLVLAIKLILTKKAHGIYHVASLDFATNYNFIVKLADVFRFNKNLILKVKFDDFFKDKNAKRAKNCWLDTTKFQKEFKNHPLNKINTSLLEFKKQISKLSPLPIDI